jgi:hypothetical protein
LDAEDVVGLYGGYGEADGVTAATTDVYVDYLYGERALEEAGVEDLVVIVGLLGHHGCYGF